MAARESGKSGIGPSPSATGGSDVSSIDISVLEDRLLHRFADRALIDRALSHASVERQASNERLEFLGDRVLGLIVADKLHADHPDIDEGGLAVRLNALVRREACARAAEAAGLAEHLAVASSELAEGRAKSAVLAGACEAVIAALYLDGGYDAARNFVLRYWADAFADQDAELRDAKTALQEWAQSGALPGKVQPAYTVSKRVGPDHAPRFTVEVLIEGLPPQIGDGHTKREAEQAAARAMLTHLGLWRT